MIVKLVELVFLTYLCCPGTDARSVKFEENSKRFILDWAAAAASFLTHSINASVSVIFKAECVTCKCTQACSAEQFTHSLLGITPSERIACGVQYWDSIDCTGVSKSNATIHPNIVSTPASIPTTPGCDKLCSITAVAKSQSQMNQNAKMCAKGNRNTNEALPMTCCSLNISTTWQKGPQVMPNCSSIPHYTPVAAFINNVYIPGTSGIFAGCLTNGEQGFQLIYQDCLNTPGLLHISKQHKENNDPSIFHIIQ
ncbi:uncharacterized protein LOC132741238 [Ruditapes philippinarum]|uniref:uncharacterized protein LOC132741238 n=1 Tax=Ruditapes philippinarum TaxID=129788 RepID=UPI00295BB966|nr:uncharacterized protein LOC132741238 [Ruditapes philippinarum]